MRVGIVGSREFCPEGKAWIASLVDSLSKDDVVVSGDAIGPDSWAEEAAKERAAREVGVKNGFPEPIIHPVPNKKYDSKKAFAIAAKVRNTKIVEGSDVIISFYDGVSRGSLDTMQKALAQDKPLFVVQTEFDYMHMMMTWRRAAMSWKYCFELREDELHSLTLFKYSIKDQLENDRQAGMINGLMNDIGAPTHFEREDGEQGPEFSLYGRVQRALGLRPGEYRWDYNIGSGTSLKYHLKAAYLWAHELHDLLTDIHTGYRGNKDWRSTYTSQINDYVVHALVGVERARNLLHGAIELLSKKSKKKE
jgi:hypothetical protein